LINLGTIGFSRRTLFSIALGIEKVTNICTRDRSHEERITQKWRILVKYASWKTAAVRYSVGSSGDTVPFAYFPQGLPWLHSL